MLARLADRARLLYEARSMQGKHSLQAVFKSGVSGCAFYSLILRLREEIQSITTAKAESNRIYSIAWTALFAIGAHLCDSQGWTTENARHGRIYALHLAHCLIDL